MSGGARKKNNSRNQKSPISRVGEGPNVSDFINFDTPEPNAGYSQQGHFIDISNREDMVDTPPTIDFEKKYDEKDVSLSQNSMTQSNKSNGVIINSSSELKNNRESPDTLITVKTNKQNKKQNIKDPEKNKPEEKKNVNITEHLLTLNEVSQKYNTSINFSEIETSHGLEKSVAERLLIENGPNILTPPKSKSIFEQFFECLNNLFNILLIIAGILQYVLLGIDPKDNQSSNMIPTTCICIRDGSQSEINASELVLGDLVFVRMGDKVPADLYVIQSEDLKVDNSSLTGESEPQERFAKNTMTSPLEATNLVFNGTHCVSGRCYGIVIRTGDETVLGQIANLTNNAGERKSPLALEIDKFVKLIAGVAIVTAIIFFIVGQVINNNISFSVNFAIGMFVAWIPEGLPATVTMLLTFAAKRLSKRQVLVKNLKGVDTLGAITLLATDKTGTLTRNQMTVAYLWSNGRIVSSSQTGDSEIEVFESPDEVGIKNILYSCTLCSSAKFDRKDVPIDKRVILTDATEAGLIRFAGLKLNDFDQLVKDYPKVFEIPFNSTNKWMMTIHRAPHQSGLYTMYIKGAPERVLSLCSSIIYNNSVEPLTERRKKEYNENYEFMASKGHRVLAFAELELNSNQFPEGYTFEKNPANHPTTGYTFIGLTSLEDPPKHGVREAIGRFRGAGIQVIMVTGDHPLTAEAIGRKINLVLGETKAEVAKRTNRNIEDVSENEFDAVVIHGESIDSMSDSDWDLVFRKPEVIFARTSPKNKLQIVQRAQSIGHIVGVTGDGVNDSPALKKSDLGIAMNKSGSDVSKEAASMILLDDNFSSTINGVEEGRLIFANIKKSIRYTVSHSVPEVIPQLLNILVPFPIILGALQIILIDLGFELFNSLSYAWEPVESKEGLMREVPRNPVSEKSIIMLREYKARHISEYDPDTGELIVNKGINKYISMIKKPFTKVFWKDISEKKIGENLVDGDLLSYSYLEAGMIITVGCFVTWSLVLNFHGISLSDARNMSKDGSYFKSSSPDYRLSNGKILTGSQQVQYSNEASTAYYIGIFLIQSFNVFACKTRYRMPFGNHMFKNKFTLFSIMGGAIVCFFVAYFPPLNTAFNTSYKLSPVWWLPLIGFGFILLIYSALRTLVLRKYKPMKMNPDIAGLQMYPTIWSTRGSKV
ncbi:Sodium/potassium-transporting ATPase subunit alpha-2 [Smittium mucronatum]|uniref:Sodium/potassium-transporting ATPase subunit alpha-2 n=1 Tax=Smittium mucronatum TaxID=133383 RepID=A0A1R0GQQ0_9FUNG|nr:Sodium/potassium-transporting ATPase subunit alpha-2 [Smittium mucronatum]